jgi:hypothetical protein
MNSQVWVQTGASCSLESPFDALSVLLLAILLPVTWNEVEKQMYICREFLTLIMNYKQLLLSFFHQIVHKFSQVYLKVLLLKWHAFLVTRRLISIIQMKCMPISAIPNHRCKRWNHMSLYICTFALCCRNRKNIHQWCKHPYIPYKLNKWKSVTYTQEKNSNGSMYGGLNDPGM